jgi:hypothetical protein
VKCNIERTEEAEARASEYLAQAAERLSYHVNALTTVISVMHWPQYHDVGQYHLQVMLDKLFEGLQKKKKSLVKVQRTSLYFVGKVLFFAC